MLKTCRDTFENIYRKYGDSIITDNYILDEGTYLLIDNQGEIKRALNVKKGEADRTNDDYSFFSNLDYLSKIENTNKAVPSEKKIHSNNYLSVFVKKEALKSPEGLSNEEKKKLLLNEHIDKYFTSLQNPYQWYSGKKGKLDIYSKFEKNSLPIDEEKLLFFKNWIRENIRSVLGKIEGASDKGYLKIFFDDSIERYINESERYILPNIYNDVAYNVSIEGSTYGLPDNNMGLNSKKPYLHQKNRKNTVPYLVSSDEIINQKKLFDYLLIQASQQKYNVYLSEENIEAVNSLDELKNKDNFSGMFLRIRKAKELEIVDCDIVNSYKYNIKGLNVKAFLPINYEKSKAKNPLIYGDIKNISDLSALIDNIFFKGYLSKNYFSEAKDIKLESNIIKQSLLISRESFFTWFYKGNESSVKAIFKKIALNVIKETVGSEDLGSFTRAKEQFMLMAAIENYFVKGEEDMESIVKKIVEDLKIKVDAESTMEVYNDKEYFFLVGQLANYLIGKNKSGKKMHSLVNPILNCKMDSKLKDEIKKLFKQYNYDIFKGHKRFNNMYAMMLSYEPTGKVDDDMLLCGYLYNNLLYGNKGENVNE